MAPQSPLRVGVIGAGFMGKLHAEALGDIERRGLLAVKLEAIATRRAGKACALARRLGARHLTDGGALIDDPEIDVVVVASPTDTHSPFVRRAIARRKPVFIEKPLGRNLAEARSIARALERAAERFGLIHQVGLVLRFSPTYNALKRLASDRRNGPFLFCRFRDDQFFPTGGVYGGNWRADVNVAGGGTLLEHSIHDVDALRWLFGEPRLTDAIVVASHAPGIEKLATVTMKFPGGGVAQLSSIWHSNLARENERDIELFFEKRMIRTDGGFTSPITVHGPRGEPRTISTEEIEHRFRAMIRWRDGRNRDFPSTIGYQMYVFLRRVMGHRAAGAPLAADALGAQRVVEAAYRMGKKR